MIIDPQLAQRVVAGAIAMAGVACLAAAVVHERRMQRHRKPGVSYADPDGYAVVLAVPPS